MTSDTETVRLFTGLPCPEFIFRERDHIPFEKADQKNVRKIPDENLHITLLFLGNIHKNDLTTVGNKIKKVAEGTVPLSLSFKGFTLVPSKKYPRMVWAEFEKSEHFTRLTHQMHEALSDHMKKDMTRKTPVPHITVARFRKRDQDIKLPEIKKSKIILSNEIILWKSELSPKGARYSVIDRYLMSE